MPRSKNPRRGGNSVSDNVSLKGDDRMNGELEKKAKNTKYIAIILLCIIGLPILYLMGYFNGYSLGYKAGINDATETIEVAKFNFYYVKPPEQKYGVDELKAFINCMKWLVPYKAGVFDCSEMSAYLEWKLENEGWHALIIVGKSPDGSSGNHAWVLVETSKGKYMPVETTTLQVVLWDSPYFGNYFEYDFAFEDIQEALRYSETEFDWWN